MNSFRSLTILLVAVSAGYCTPPPPPEPIQQVIERFESEHLPLCESVAEKMRRHLSDAEKAKYQDSLSALDVYLRNMRSDDLWGLKRAFSPRSDGGLDYWSFRAVTDTVGYRRIADQVAIEVFASSSLKADAEFLDLMKRFWKSERYFSWRFAIEFAPERTPQKPNQPVEPTPVSAPH